MTKSASFVADLPADMSPDQLEKLYTWAKKSCSKFDVQLDNETQSMTLVAIRTKECTAREHQRLLRTNLLNWGCQMPAKMSGWLRIIDQDGAPDEHASTETNATSRELVEAPEEGTQGATSDSEEPVYHQSHHSEPGEKSERQKSPLDNATSDLFFHNATLSQAVPASDTRGLLKLPENLLFDHGRLFHLLHVQIAAH